MNRLRLPGISAEMRTKRRVMKNRLTGSVKVAESPHEHQMNPATAVWTNEFVLTLVLDDTRRAKSRTKIGELIR